MVLFSFLKCGWFVLRMYRFGFSLDPGTFESAYDVLSCGAWVFVGGAPVNTGLILVKIRLWPCRHVIRWFW